MDSHRGEGGEVQGRMGGGGVNLVFKGSHKGGEVTHQQGGGKGGVNPVTEG